MANKIMPPTHGPYQRRADLVHAALAVLIQEEYGKTVIALKRGSDQNLTYTWGLSDRVTVIMRKSAGSGDPAVWVNRADPTGRTDPKSDWKNEVVERSYGDKTYDLDAIMAKIKGAVDHNRNHGQEDTENKKAMLEELKGVPMLSGADVRRDPKTGLYTIHQEMSVKDVKLEEAKRLLTELSKLGAAPKGEQSPVKQPEGAKK